MSGHSKWANIKHKKGKADALRGKITTKISREITIAVRMGGADPTGNMKLKLALSKAKANNIPKDNIQRAIQKGAGALEGQSFEEITYEGYGPCGVAVIVETMTDNRNRTASEMRHYFDKYGGNMGTTGCVSWSFDKKGVIVIDNEDGKLDEDSVLEAALEAGADDCEADGPTFAVYTSPDDFQTVASALEAKGYKFLSAEVEMVPQNYIKLTNEDDIKNMNKMLDMFEDNDDVQNVWHNWENDEN